MLSNEERMLLLLVKDYISSTKIAEDLWGTINSEELLSLIEKHKLLPLLHDIIFPHLNKDAFNQYIDKYNSFIRKTDIYYNECKTLFNGFHKLGLKAVLLKGMLLSYRIYESLYARTFGDVDILVNEKDMLLADKYLRQIGYVQFNDFNESQELDFPILKLADNHEYFPYRKNISGINVYVEIGKSLHERIRGDSIMSMILNSEPYPSGDSSIWVLSVDDTLIQIIENTYDNSFSDYSLAMGGVVLRDYIDLLAFVKKYNVTPDRIVEIVVSYNMARCAYCIINDLHNLFPDLVWPLQVLDKLMSCIGIVERLSDRHWIQAKLFKQEESRKRLNYDLKTYVYGIINPSFTNISSEYAGVKVTINASDMFIRFRPILQSHQIFLECIVPSPLVDQFDEFMLHFQMYNNNINSLDSTITVNIFGIGQKIYYCLTNQLYRANEDIFIKRGTMISEKTELVPISSSIESSKYMLYLPTTNFNLSLDDINVIALDLSVHKKMEENIYHQIGKCPYPPLFACVSK